MKRGHEDLASEYKETDQRNAILFRTWRDAHGDSPEEKKAHSMFASGEFVEVKNIPVFKEHEYVEKVFNADGTPKLDEDGNEVIKVHRYGFYELKEIAEKANYRIRNTGDFAPLTLGHTKTDPNNPGSSAAYEEQPKVAGFTGPYRVGMFGNEEPLWTIFQDEFRYADMNEEVKRNPRRSPELFLSKEKRFFDPVAALGAVTPRLDLGIHYQVDSSDEQVVRYSCPYVVHDESVISRYEMAACPGGGAGQNVSLPEDKKPKYEQPVTGASSMSDEDIRRILEAIRAMPEMEAVRQWMEQEKSPKADEEGADLGIPEEGVEPAPEPKEQAEQPAMKPEEMGGPGPEKPETEPKDEREDMANASKPAKKDKEEARGYSDIETKARYAAMEQRLVATEARVLAAENKAVNATRKSMLEKLRRQYAFDLDRQVQKCAADVMGEKQFGEHCEDIVANFRQIPIDLDLFVPAIDDYSETKQRNEREMAAAAVKYSAEQQPHGEIRAVRRSQAHRQWQGVVTPVLRGSISHF